MLIPLLEIPEAERTPLVRQLLDIIRLQQERLHRLEHEIARLGGFRKQERLP